jgi:hypothetical protein
LEKDRINQKNKEKLSFKIRNTIKRFIADKKADSSFFGCRHEGYELRWGEWPAGTAHSEPAIPDLFQDRSTRSARTDRNNVTAVKKRLTGSGLYGSLQYYSEGKA